MSSSKNSHFPASLFCDEYAWCLPDIGHRSRVPPLSQRLSFAGDLRDRSHVGSSLLGAATQKDQEKRAGCRRDVFDCVDDSCRVIMMIAVVTNAAPRPYPPQAKVSWSLIVSTSRSKLVRSVRLISSAVCAADTWKATPLSCLPLRARPRSTRPRRPMTVRSRGVSFLYQDLLITLDKRDGRFTDIPC